jgi:Xaa-Pro dipeptidase
MWYAPAQAFMRDRRIDAWLLHDFRGSNSALAQLLPGKRTTTRRADLFIPASGEPAVLAHVLDAAQFAASGVRVETYTTWPEYRAWLSRALEGRPRVAMEYSAGCNLPVVSMVDAGTIDLLRAMGAEVVTSADLIQVCIARWTPEAIRVHKTSAAGTEQAMHGAWEFIRAAIAGGRTVTELDVQRHIVATFTSLGLEYPDPPIVGVNGHSGDPHFEASSTNPSPIRRGDWVLIDLWARVPGDENVYSDITWTGFIGKEPPAEHLRVFNTVRDARDAAVARAAEAFRTGEPVQGWQLDEAARGVIIAAGYGAFIKHRTGHSLSAGPRVHGVGVNIDNTESHDTREVMPGIGFTVEPGIYTPAFGVRNEIDVYMDPAKGPVVTSCSQDRPVLVG